MEAVLYSTEVFINQWGLRIFQGLQPNKMPARKHHVNKPPLRNYHWCFQAFAIAESHCHLCSCISGCSNYFLKILISVSWLWHIIEVSTLAWFNAYLIPRRQRWRSSCKDISSTGSFLFQTESKKMISLTQWMPLCTMHQERGFNLDARRQYLSGRTERQANEWWNTTVFNVM